MYACQLLKVYCQQNETVQAVIERVIKIGGWFFTKQTTNFVYAQKGGFKMGICRKTGKVCIW